MIGSVARACLGEELAMLRGRRVYFHRFPGNLGDQLIAMGAFAAMRRAGIRLVREAADAEAILITGGGAMNNFWGVGLAALEQMSREQSETPLIVLPQTYLLDGVDLGRHLAGRRAPAVLFARERTSLAALEGAGLPGGVRIGLDHDMAMHLIGTAWIDRLKARARADHVLIVERTDLEATTPAGGPVRGIDRLKRMVPTRVKRPIKRLLGRGDGPRPTAYSDAALGLLLADLPSLRGLPVHREDISEPPGSLRRFMDLIARAGAVYTNRLHVGIGAALLGKPTYMESGNYFKIRAVFEHSLAGWPNVRMVDAAEDPRA